MKDRKSKGVIVLLALQGGVADVRSFVCHVLFHKFFFSLFALFFLKRDKRFFDSRSVSYTLHPL